MSDRQCVLVKLRLYLHLKLASQEISKLSVFEQAILFYNKYYYRNLEDTRACLRNPFSVT